MKTCLMILLIIALGAVAYSNSLGNDFVWDDETFIVTNDYIKNMRFIPMYFTSRNALASGDLAMENFRPFLPLSFAIDYSIWKLNPMGYHAVNLVLHILNALLLFYFVLLITKDRYIGLFASLVFLLHPVQTEAVSWISGRADVLFLFFYFSSLILYIRYWEKGKIVLYFLSLLSFVFALFSKEMAASLPFIFLLYDWLYGKEERVGLRAAAYFPFLLALEVFVLVRFTVLGRFSQTGYWTGDFYTTFLSMLKGIAHYIKIILYPVGLCADHLTFAVSRTIKDPSVIFSLLAILAILGLSVYYAKKIKHVSFSVLWFFVTLAPVANIIPIKILIAERFLYLPLAGFAIMLAAVLRFLYIRSRKKLFLKYPIILFSAAIILAYSYLTYERNFDWADEVVFNEKVIEMYPDNPRAHYNLAFALMRRKGDIQRAHAEAAEAVRIMPEHYRARMLLASQYVYMKKPKKAIEELKRVIEIRPDLADAYEKLALAYQMQGKYYEALAQYRRSLAWDSLDIDANKGLAGLYALSGEREKAIRIYEGILSEGKKAYYADPRYAAIYLDLGAEYAFSQEKAKAREAWREVHEKFGARTPLGAISRFLVGDIALDRLIELMRTWPERYKAMGYYYAGVRKELEKDGEGAEEYYKKCLGVPTKSIEPVTVYAYVKIKTL